MSEPEVAPRRRGGKTLAWTSTTYFGEGLPWSFLHQMVTEFFTAARAPLWMVSATSWLHLSTTLKFAWAPLVDLFGSKRGWMVLLQFVLGVGMVLVAWLSTGAHLGLFWAALAVLAVIHATHDIACDGYYMAALPKHDQALYSGARIAAFRCAMWVGSSVLVVVAGRYSWFAAFAAAGGLMMLVGALNAITVPRLARAPIPVDGAATSRPRSAAFGAAYRTFFTQPHAALVLAFMFSFKLGDIMIFAMSRPLLRDIGISTAQRGFLATPQLIAQIVSAVLAGAVVAKWGLERCLIPLTLLMNAAIPLYTLMAWTAPSFGWVLAIVVVEQFIAGMGNTLQTLYLMQRTRKAFSASHYAFASAIVALGSTVTGGLSGWLDQAVGHRVYFLLCNLFAVPSSLLVFWVPRAPLDDDPAV